MTIMDIEFDEIKSAQLPSEYKVLVFCKTYNQKNFVEDALKGFICQKTNFDYKIIIIDDASTDGTIEILKKYQKDYPHLFHLLLAKTNFFKRNRIEIHNAINRQYFNGKYVAICEGDDYWTDEYKLQKQYDYLEANQGCSMYIHNAIIRNYEDMSENEMISGMETGIASMQALIMQQHGIFPTASFMVKREYTIIDDFFAECGVGDLPIQLKAASKGYIYYSDECMSVYRYMHAASWSKSTYDDLERRYRHFSRIAYFLHRYDEYTDYKYTDLINDKVFSLFHCVESETKDAETAMALLEKSKNGLEVKYQQFLDDNIRFYSQKLSGEYVDENLQKFLNRFHSIYIMGTGNYSRKLSDELKLMGYDFAGYVVSNNQNKTDFFMKKRVLYLKDLSGKADVGILIGIDTFGDKRVEIEESLSANKIVNTYFPYTNRRYCRL